MRCLRTPALAGVVAALTLLAGAAGAGEDRDLVAPLRAAAEALATAAPAADPMKSLTEVVGLLSQVAERGKLAPEVRHKVDAAHAGLEAH